MNRPKTREIEKESIGKNPVKKKYTQVNQPKTWPFTDPYKQVSQNVPVEAKIGVCGEEPTRAD